MLQLLTPLKRLFTRCSIWVVPVMVGFLAGQVLLTSPALAITLDEVPDLLQPDSAWVFDQADVLSRATEGAVKSKLRDLSKQNGIEIRMVTGHRLNYGVTSDSFAMDLFEKWFPDAEAQTNQLVLFLDDVTNDAAIVRGDQVKTLLADDVTESVTQETMAIPLRNGNKYNEAFTGAADRLVAVLSGAPDPGPPAVVDTTNVEGTFASAEDTDTSSSTIIVVVLLLVATIVPMATYFFYQN